MSALPQQPPSGNTPPDRPVHHLSWKKAVAWSAGILGGLIAVMVIAVITLLHSRTLHGYVLNVAQQKASSALGTQVLVQDYALHFSGISPVIDVFGVMVQGAPPYQDSHLLTVDHIHVVVRVTSILKRTWYLQDIQINHPVVRILIDKNGTNLPENKSSGQSNTSVFDLGIRHAVINRGEAYYNDQKAAISADLHELRFQSRFTTAGEEYAGTLSYNNGALVIGDFNPISHSLHARFTATPQKFTLQDTTLTSGSSQILVNATMQDYSQPKVYAAYAARISSTEFRRIIKKTLLPVGIIQFTGSGTYHSEPNVLLLKTVSISGDLTSPVLAVNSSGFHGEIRNLAAHYVLANGNAEVTGIRGNVLGGALIGNAQVLDFAGTQHGQATFQLQRVNLADLRSITDSSELRKIDLNGTASLNLGASWTGSTKNLIANISGFTRGTVHPKGTAQPTPLQAQFSARYSGPQQLLTIGPTYVRTSGGSLNLNGGLGGGQVLQVRLNSLDLHSLENLLSANSMQSLRSIGLAGLVSFNGTVSGTTSNPDLNGRLSVVNLQFHGTRWPSLIANIHANPSQASISNGQLRPAGAGTITFDASTGLSKWKLTENGPLSVNMRASRVQLSGLAQAADKDLPASGTLNATIALHGSMLNPIGQGTIKLSNANISGQPIRSAILDFQGKGSEVHGNAAVSLTAGTAHLIFSYLPKQQSYDVKLSANGIQLDQLQVIKAKKLQLQGVVNLNASGQGTINNPEITATLQTPQLTVQGQMINDLTLDAKLTNHMATFSLNSQVANTSIRGSGKLNLTDGYDINATLDTQQIPLQPLIAMYAPTQAPNLTGATELHAAISGPLKNKSLLNAQITIPTLRLKYKDQVEIGAASPIRIDYVNGVLQLQRARIQGTDTDLQLQGSVPISTNAPMSLLLLGTVNLQLAQLADPDLTSSGQLRFDINSYGQRSNPNIEGEIHIVNANFAMADLPLGLQNGNGTLTLTKDRLNITQFQGLIGGGPVTARGGIIFRPSLRFDLAFAGRGMRFIYPEGVREGVDANLSLTGTTQAAQLTGQVRLDNLSFTPDFDLTNFMGQFSGETVPPPSQGFAQDLKLNVAVQSTSGLNASNRSLSLQANANLRLVGTAAQPVVLGRLNVTGGDLIFMGNRYVLQGGTLDFVNPTQIQPVVNMAVNTTIQQYDIHMRFWGPADRMHTSYSSDPALPPSDIINLVAFGKTAEASAANPTPGNLGAESLIASQVSGQVTNRISKIAGISQLSVDPVLGGAQRNTGARVTVQQRVTSNLFVTFSSDITSTQTQQIEVQYHLSPRMTIIGTRDQNGGFGFDTRFRRTW